MPRSGAEVAGVELVDGTDLSKGRVGGWSTTATGGASPGRGTRRGRGGAARPRAGSVPEQKRIAC